MLRRSAPALIAFLVLSAPALRAQEPASSTPAASGAGASPTVQSAPTLTPTPSPEAATPAPSPSPSPSPSYSVLFDARIVPTEKVAYVTIDLRDPDERMGKLEFRIDPERHLDFAGDGKVEVNGETVAWTPPPRGGKLRYRFRINHLRNERSYDARVSDSWAIFRGDDMVPRTRVRTAPGAHGDSRLRLRVPVGWSVVAPYERLADGTYAVVDENRRFDRPSGWIGMGDLGVLRETIADTRVAIAAPKGQGFRRQDLLALLRWTLPTLRETLPSLPDRLVIVGAGDPMWRGGISGPRSLFAHADRASISEDGTSPIVHELVHTALRLPSGPGGDWVVEGLAELYSLRVLRRSGTISKRRYDRSIERLEKKARGVKNLRGNEVDAAETARAALVLLELDKQLDTSTDGRVRLDDVVRELAATDEEVTTERFREVAERVSQTDLEEFFARPELAAPKPSPRS